MEDNIISRVREAREQVKFDINSGIKYESKKIMPLAIGKRLSYLRLSPVERMLTRLSGNLWLRSMLAKNPTLHDFVRAVYRKILFRKGF